MYIAGQGLEVVNDVNENLFERMSTALLTKIYPKDADEMTRNADPDQTFKYCLHRPVCSKTKAFI